MKRPRPSSRIAGAAEFVETPQLKRGDWGRRVAERRFAATFPTPAARAAALAARQRYIAEFNAGLRGTPPRKSLTFAPGAGERRTIAEPAR